MGNREFEDIHWEAEFPEVPECVHSAVAQANEMILQKENKKVRRMSRKGILLLASCLTLVCGMTVLAASSLWQQRMEAMNEKELEEYFLSINTSNAPSFRYSRGLNAEESDLFQQLTVAYEEGGIFPAGCVTMLDNYKEYTGKGVGYDPASGTFFLPEELSEEEILQIVDFYHKAEYSIQSVNELVENGEMELPQPEEDVLAVIPEAEPEIKIMQEFETLNEAVSYFQLQVPSEDFAQEIATGSEYLYLGYTHEIQRMTMGEKETECFLTLPENQTLVAIDADLQNHLYLSVREYVAETDSYVNRLFKLDEEGNQITEYDVKSAVFSEERSLEKNLAYKMLEGDDGRLYVKARWGSGVLIYVFAEDGSYLDAIYDGNQNTHPAGGMCFGEDGMLYVLGKEEIIKVDTESKSVVETYAYATGEMVAAVDLLYPMDEDSFYLLSYDGLFVTTLGEGTSQRILAPYESEIFGEGCRSYSVSEDTIVTANFLQPDIKITYLRIEK